MTIHKKIKEDIKDGLRAKNEAKLRAARNVLTAFVNELVAQKKKPSEVLDDESALTVLKRLAKQRKESIEQFEAGGREALAEAEKEELAYLEAFLPKLMSKEEIEKIVITKKEELGIDNPSKIGILMGAVMKELKGQADGKDVREVVESLLK
jgi:uncharacterized protein